MDAAGGSITVAQARDLFSTSRKYALALMNRRTLQRDIEGLIDKGLVITEGATNQLRYRLRPEA